MAKFEVVSDYAGLGIKLPTRATAQAAGYDFAVAEDTIIPPYDVLYADIANYAAYQHPKDTDLFDTPLMLNELADIVKGAHAKPTLVPTGIKCKLDPGTYLELSVRSSTPLKYWLILANSIGIIDADYYQNSSNEGHIYFQLINLSPFPIVLKKGDIIGQGIIHSYLKTEDDNAQGLREGGFGSTSAASQPVLQPAT